MSASDPPPCVARYGRVGFYALALFGSAAVGYVAGGMAGYPLVGLVLAAAYPAWVLVRGRRGEA